MRRLTENDFNEAAELLGCEFAAVKAVAEVESAGAGFLKDGRLRILFEGHWFFRLTRGAHQYSHPTICYPKWTREFYAKGRTADARGAGEFSRLEQAMALNREAALKSASYGKFQIMGFNFALCGFNAVEDFYAAMQQDEGQHLAAFCQYIKNSGLDDELRERDWVRFARLYNGPEYRKNNYDGKLRRAYEKHARTAPPAPEKRQPSWRPQSNPKSDEPPPPVAEPSLIAAATGAIVDDVRAVAASSVAQNGEPSAVLGASLPLAAKATFGKIKKFILPSGIVGGGLLSQWGELLQIFGGIKGVAVAAFIIAACVAAGALAWRWRKERAELQTKMTILQNEIAELRTR
jgi:hypothetical protein